MRPGRLILAAVIVATGVFASFFGGTVAYALFWCSLMAPLGCMAYILYVYLRFKVFQQTGRKTLVKGEVTPFTMVLANEDFVTYERLQVRFFQDSSTIVCQELLDGYCLTPGEKRPLNATLCCNYRGSYHVGIESIVISDYLHLFSMTYPNRSQINATVLPRVLELSSLVLLPTEEDAKRTRFDSAASDEELDVETRGYIRGDSPRLIHWKVSARRGDLLVRKSVSSPRTGVAVIFDVSDTGYKEHLARLIVEDKVVETALACANYCLSHRMDCQVYSGREFSVTNKGEMDIFYEFCGKVSFSGPSKAQALAEQGLSASHCIIITHRLTPGLYKAATALSRGGRQVSLALCLYQSDAGQEELAAFCRDGGVSVTIMYRDDDPAQVLEGGQSQ